MERATRSLVLVQLVLAVAALAVAAWCLWAYGRRGPDDDPLIGFLVLYAVAALAYSTVTGVLALVWLRTRAPGVSLALGVWGLVCVAVPGLVMLGAEWWWVLAGLTATAVPLATVVVSAIGLARAPVSPAR